MQSLSDEGVYDSNKTTAATYAAAVAHSLTRENSDSSRNSQKRKSFEENDENLPANTKSAPSQSDDSVAKKSRVATTPVNSAAVNTNSTAAAKTSKIARFGAPNNSSTSTRSKTQSSSTYAPAVSATPTRGNATATVNSNNASASSSFSGLTSPRTRAASKAAATTPSINRAPVPEIASPSAVNALVPVGAAIVAAPPVASMTPRRPQTNERAISQGHGLSSAVVLGAETPRISTNTFIKKMQKDLVDEVTGNVFSSLMDRYIPSQEARLLEIENSMKSKGTSQKWDLKERSKAMSAAVRSYREIIAVFTQGVKQTREAGATFEQRASSNIRDCYDHLLDDAQLIAQQLKAEKNLKKEIENLQNELRTESGKLNQFKAESINSIRKAETDSLLKDQQIVQLNEKICELEIQLSKLQKSHEEQLSEVKQSQSKHSDDMVKVYQLEISHLQANQKRFENDHDRQLRDHDELVKKNMQLMEELATWKSNSKDSEINKDVLERDVNRLSAECALLKDTITRKDEDLRLQMQNAHEWQRSNLEEKANMRAEQSAMNMRLNSLEEERRNLTASVAQHKATSVGLQKEVDLLTAAKVQLEAQLQQADSEVSQGREAVTLLEVERTMRIATESRAEEDRRQVIALTSQLFAIQSEANKAVKETEERMAQYQIQAQQQIEELSNARSAAAQEAKENADCVLGLKEEIQQLHVAMESNDFKANREQIEELGRCKGELEVLKQRIADASQALERQTMSESRRIADFEEKLLVSETQRRKLHNLVQELRGNIRVFARVRPFLPNDGYEMSSLPDPSINVRADLNSLKIARAVSADNHNKREDYDFNFDKVFGQSCSQETLFGEVAEFVQSALDGYQVCLFSYGQTGSGKTHTMNGSGEGSMRGIIPRAMEQVGLYKKQLQEKGWQYHMEVSFLEIYNEAIRDLLRKDASNDSNASKHDIKKDAQGNVYVTELTRIPVDPEDFQQIMQIMDMAAQHRSVAQTLMNDRSSRSHAVFTLHLKASNPSQGVELNGALNLVDLAGSERVDRSGVTGNDFKETVAINKSLSSLADVFSALANKQPHVPYRNSKLTFLLQPALSGDGKTLMIVNLSPTEASYFESLSSLRFASQVSQCELGKPKRRLKDVGIESTSSKQQPVSAAASRDADEQGPSAAVSSTPSKKLTQTWEGSASTRATNSNALSASLGAKRPLETTSASSKIATSASSSLRSAASSSLKKSAVLPTSSRAATAAPKTPSRK